MTKLRRRLIYEIFIRHFVQSCTKCLEFENHKFIPIYIRQARRLIELLNEDGFEIDASGLRDNLRDFEMKLRNPELAKRRLTKKKSIKRIVIPNNTSPVIKSINNKPISPSTFSPMSPNFLTETRKKSVLGNGSVNPPISPNFLIENRKRSVIGNAPILKNGSSAPNFGEKSFNNPISPASFSPISPGFLAETRKRSVFMNGGKHSPISPGFSDQRETRKKSILVKKDSFSPSSILKTTAEVHHQDTTSFPFDSHNSSPVTRRIDNGKIDSDNGHSDTKITSDDYYKISVAIDDNAGRQLPITKQLAAIDAENEDSDEEKYDFRL